MGFCAELWGKCVINKYYYEFLNAYVTTLYSSFPIRRPTCFSAVLNHVSPKPSLSSAISLPPPHAHHYLTAQPK